MKKIFTFIILGIVIIAAVILSIFTKQMNAHKYNEGYVNGNTAGNLYNNGLFCEYKDKIYFANADDGNRLYCMDKNGANQEKLSEDSVASINVDENYVYYARTGGDTDSGYSFFHYNTNSLCKIRRDGKGEVFILDEAPAMYASLVGNYLYYLHYDTETATTFYRVKNDGTEMEQISSQPHYPCATNSQYIYYNGISGDHNIYQYDTVTGSRSVLYTGNCWMPVIDGDYVYFLDLDNNYALAKVDLSNNEKTIICNDFVECFNLYNGTIYFQRGGNSPALCKINTDGSQYTVIKDGAYNSLNIAGGILYFVEFSSEKMYRLPL